MMKCSFCKKHISYLIKRLIVTQEIYPSAFLEEAPLRIHQKREIQYSCPECKRLLHFESDTEAIEAIEKEGAQ